MLKLRPAAEQDIAEAIAWYDEKEPSLGDEFLSEVIACFERASSKPIGYPTTYRTFNRALVRRFPYAVHFRVEGTDIVVFAVYHPRRNTESLRKRLDA